MPTFAYNVDVINQMSPEQVNEDKKANSSNVSNSDLPIKPQERLFTILKPWF